MILAAVVFEISYADKHTDRQRDRQTNAGETPTPATAFDVGNKRTALLCSLKLMFAVTKDVYVHKVESVHIRKAMRLSFPQSISSRKKLSPINYLKQRSADQWDCCRQITHNTRRLFPTH